MIHMKLELLHFWSIVKGNSKVLSGTLRTLLHLSPRIREDTLSDLNLPFSCLKSIQRKNFNETSMLYWQSCSPMVPKFNEKPQREIDIFLHLTQQLHINWILWGVSKKTSELFCLPIQYRPASCKVKPPDLFAFQYLLDGTENEIVKNMSHP